MDYPHPIESTPETPPVRASDPQSDQVRRPGATADVPCGGRGAAKYAWVAFLFAVGLAAGLRLWGLSQNGYGNPYYAAAVRSMLASWHNFFFAAFDPAGFVAVDKPPVALWLQTLSAKLLGYRGIMLLVPQALAGVATVALVFGLVRRLDGSGAALLAAVVLALTPIAVAVDRTNNLDSLLVLVLVLAAGAVLRAATTGSVLYLLLSAVLFGIGFNVKMVAAFIVLPACWALYLLGGPGRWPVRCLRLLGATGVLAVVASSWAVAVDLTPPAERPFVGGSQNNTVRDLVFGYNGFGRVAGGQPVPGGGLPIGPGAASRRPFPGGAGPGPVAPPGFPPPPGGMPFPLPGAMPFPPGGGPFGGGVPGPLRLAGPGLADQVSWLFPLAIVGAIAVLLPGSSTAPRGSSRRATWLWLGWLIACAAVFSFARGIFHPYYLVMLAPPLAALSGAGTRAAWDHFQKGGWRTGLLPVALMLTAVWQAYVLRSYAEWARWLLPILWGGTGVAVAGLVVARLFAVRFRGTSGWQIGLMTLGLGALLVSPTAWALTSVIGVGVGLMPAAGPGLLARSAPFGRPGTQERGSAPRPFGPPSLSTRQAHKLISFLESQRATKRYLLVTSAAMSAAPMIIETAAPVIALGGFMGADPIVSLPRFEQMIADKQVRFVLLTPMDGMAGGDNASIFSWVRDHGELVDPPLWQENEAAPEAPPTRGPTDSAASHPAEPRGGFFSFLRSGSGTGLPLQLYDCAQQNLTHR